MSKGKILFQFTGSIACFKACQLLSCLMQNDFEVEVVATSSALKFVGEATLEGLSGRRVHTETFAAGSYMNHIHLIRWADLVLLCPATANSINKLASGIGDDLVSTLFLAHDFQKPYLIAPAMNTRMLEHPATKASLLKLQEWGVEILGSGKGALACGEVGDGRLMEPNEIYAQIETRLQHKVKANALNILVTAGGTREPIDGVRAITNFSTGRTGAAIAEHLSKEGHKVTLLRAVDAARALAQSSGSQTREIEFSTFNELSSRLNEELGSNHYDAVIHAAAVGDYSLESIESQGKILANGKGKLESTGDTLTICLKKNPKLVDGLRAISKNPKIQIVAFKLTNTSDPTERQDAIASLAKHARPDFIVHNDLSEITERQHITRIFSVDQPGQLHEIAKAPTKNQTAEVLGRLLEKSGVEL